MQAASKNFIWLRQRSMPVEDARKLKEGFETYFGVSCSMNAIPLSLATHLGYGTYGLALIRKMDRQLL